MQTTITPITILSNKLISSSEELEKGENLSQKVLTSRKEVVTIKLMSYADEFFNEKDFAASTLETYRSIFRRFDVWVDGKAINLKTMTGSEFKQFLAANPWGDNARHQAYSAVRSFIRWKYGDKHPFLRYVMKKPVSKPQRSLSVDQVRVLLDAINMDRPSGLRNVAILSLILDTGLRRAEVAGLLLENTDLEKRTITVKIKGGNWGIGRFSEMTADALDDWLTIRPAYAKAVVKNLFISIGGNTPGQALTVTGVGTIFKYLTKCVGFSVSPHDLRRTFAALTQENGAPTEIVRRAGRWANIEQVKSYSVGLQPEAIDPYLVMNRL